MSLSIPRQVERMQDDWPHFLVVEKARQFVCWEGPLRPHSQRHDVRISLFRERGSGRGNYRLIPEVIVLNPALRRRRDDPNDPIPHLYRNRRDSGHPMLCLYRPYTREWHAGCHVADRIVPWASEWLACYEIWLATGKWLGGGTTPSERFRV